FFFYRSAHHRALHSFPTRRSSDLTDVAVIGEVHYTGSLGSGEFHGEEIDWASNVFVSTPAGGSLDMVNLTGGLHLQFGPQMSLRVSGVVPVADDPFTNEFTAQWTYWY